MQLDPTCPYERAGVVWQVKPCFDSSSTFPATLHLDDDAPGVITSQAYKNTLDLLLKTKNGFLKGAILGGFLRDYMRE